MSLLHADYIGWRKIASRDCGCGGPSSVASVSVTVEMYRVSQQVSDLGWVYFDFGRSTLSPILLGLMRDMLNGQSRWTS